MVLKVILLAVFSFKIQASRALDLPVFACRDLHGMCDGPGEYACSVRPRVSSCMEDKVFGKDQAPLAICRMKCHFHAQCESFLWDEIAGTCSFCAHGSNSSNTMEWNAPLEINHGAPTVVHYGVHHGHLDSFVVAGIDYVSKGYINPRESGFKRKHTLVGNFAEEVSLRVQPPFCVLLPGAFVEEHTKGKIEKKLQNIVWGLFLFLVILASWATGASCRRLRKGFLFLKHRTRATCTS